MLDTYDPRKESTQWANQGDRRLNLIWTTDLHLDHASQGAWRGLIDAIRAPVCDDRRADGLVITGDLSEGDDVTVKLRRMAHATEMPIYFVLGNHDFYGSSISRTRQRVIATVREDGRLNYLTDGGPIELAGGCFLLGEDGWGDATEGDFAGSPVRLNDFSKIEDFRRLPPEHWKGQLNGLGEESAARLASKLESLPADADHVLILTHVPPFREACWYQGHTTDDDWAPFFVCGCVGRALRSFAATRPTTRITVLCGHTHHGGVCHLAGNLTVLTGEAIYGQPKIQGFLRIESSGIRFVARGDLA